MSNGLLGSLPEINPLADWAFSFDHFYQFVKREAGAQQDQLVQIRAAAEPLALRTDYPWFSYYSFLTKVDTDIVAAPMTENSTQETIGLTDGQLSYEFGRFLGQAVRLVELKELSPETNAQIASLEKTEENIRTRVTQLVTADADAWASYAKAMGFSPADSTAFTQWWYSFGHAQDIDQLHEDLTTQQGQIDLLRLDKFKDADQEEIFKAFTQFNSFGSRLRWPRIPDTMYKESPFTIDYLAKLPPGSSPLFADRHFFFPSGSSLADIASTNLGSIDEILTKSSSSSSSMQSDWNANASVSYLWFSVSASASEQTKIREDFKSTQTVRVSCQSLQKIKFDAVPWFNPGLFRNSYVTKNPKTFARFFGPQGTLKYYPAALLVARGMKIEFESAANYSYDYQHTFSASGSGSMRIFGFGFGGGGGYTGQQQQQNVAANGHKLTLDDGANNFRVIGYVVNKVASLDQMLFGDTIERFDKIVRAYSTRAE